MTVSRPDTSVSQSMGKFTQVTGQFPRFWACGPALAFHPDIAMINSPLITQRPPSCHFGLYQPQCGWGQSKAEPHSRSVCRQEILITCVHANSKGAKPGSCRTRNLAFYPTIG